jgi:hypothetical protein
MSLNEAQNLNVMFSRLDLAAAKCGHGRLDYDVCQKGERQRVVDCNFGSFV